MARFSKLALFRYNWEIKFSFLEKDLNLSNCLQFLSSNKFPSMYNVFPVLLFIGGAAGAVSRITGTIGKGLAALTFDDEYQKKRREGLNKKPANIGEGFARGGKGLVMVSIEIDILCGRRITSKWDTPFQ